MRNKFLVFMFLALTMSLLYSNEYKIIDEISDSGKSNQALELLEKKLDLNNPQAEVVWRIAREYYEIGDNLKNSKEMIAKFEEGISFIDKYNKNITGSVRDKAKVIHWWTVLFSRRGKEIGIIESLGNVPEIFNNCYRAIDMDPNYGDPYYLMAMVDDAIPAFIGDASKRGENAKHRMGINIMKAIEFDPENLYFLVDGAIAFYNRNWNVANKQKNNEKTGKNDGTPVGISDRDFSKTILEKAIKIYNDKSNPTKKDLVLFNKAKSILNKLK